jgi:hypothetical protein
VAREPLSGCSGPGRTLLIKKRPRQKGLTMTDLPDPAERIRSVNDSIARKRVLLEEIRAITDANARPTQEQYDAAKRAAGIDHEPEGDKAA